MGDCDATASCMQCKAARLAHLICLPASLLHVLLGAVSVLYSRRWEYCFADVWLLCLAP